MQGATAATQPIFGNSCKVVYIKLKDALRVISHYFPEMRDLLHFCKFSNCLHTEEPECNILQALESGEISASRYVSYLGILEELS